MARLFSDFVDGNSDARCSAMRAELRQAKRVLVLTGAGVSSESGIPTFRGSTSGLWRGFSVSDLANPDAFRRNPSLVWELYHYRRERCLAVKPNPAHEAIARFQKWCRATGVDFLLATQNIDRLHQRAGSSDVVELHRNLFLLRCTACGVVEENFDSPVCEALRGRGDPDVKADSTPIAVHLLPSCRQCRSLMRPYVVWFSESLNEADLRRVRDFASDSDMVITVGTSNSVYPAALIAPEARGHGVPLAEFNIDDLDDPSGVKYFFKGPCGTTLPKALPLD